MTLINMLICNLHIFMTQMEVVDYNHQYHILTEYN